MSERPLTLEMRDEISAALDAEMGGNHPATIATKEILLKHCEMWEERGGRLAEVERLRAEVQRLTDSEDSRVVLAEAENKRLRAELARAKPVLDAALAWRRWFPSADSMFVPENALIAAVDGWKNPTADEPDEEPDVCAIFGCDEQAEAWGVCGEHMPGGPAHLAAEGLSSTDTTAGEAAR